jgi:hypothetical protein
MLTDDSNPSSAGSSNKRIRIAHESIPSSIAGEELEICLQWMLDNGAQGLDNIAFESSPGVCGGSLGIFARRAMKKGGNQYDCTINKRII